MFILPVDVIQSELLRASFNNYEYGKGKAIPVTGRGGSQGCETLRLPHFLDSRLAGGGEVSLTRRPSFILQEDSWYSFLLEADSTPRP
jgi:hypothetical protein